MNIPDTINIERLKEVSQVWNQYKHHKSQIAGSFIAGIFFLVFPAVMMFLLTKDKTIPLFFIVLMGLFGVAFIVYGFYSSSHANNIKMQLNSFDRSEVVTLEEIVEYMRKLNPDSLENSFQFFHTEGGGKNRRVYNWVVFWDDKNLFALRKPKEEIHFCHMNSFSIDQKGKMFFSSNINADFHINDRNVSGYIKPEDCKKYLEWKNYSPAAPSSAASSSSSPLNSTSHPDQEHGQDDEIYKVDF